MLSYIYEDLKEACQNLPVSLAAGCGAAVLALFFQRLRRRRLPLVPIFLWAAYLEQLLWLVYLNRAPGSRRSLDLGLFDTISRSRPGKFLCGGKCASVSSVWIPVSSVVSF